MFGNGQDVDAGLSQSAAAGMAKSVEGHTLEPSQLACLVEPMPEIVRSVQVLADEDQVEVQ